jgi:hypothetical protein
MWRDKEKRSCVWKGFRLMDLGRGFLMDLLAIFHDLLLMLLKFEKASDKAQQNPPKILWNFTEKSKPTQLKTLTKKA